MGLFDKLLAPSERRFASLVTAALQEAGETHPIQHERDRFRLMIAGKPLPLAAFYQEYRTATGAGREAIVRRAVQSWRIDAPRSAAPGQLAVDRLLPLLGPRCAWELAILGQEDDAADSSWPHRLIGEHLAAAVTCDPPGAPQPLTRQDLQANGIEFAAAWAAACENLLRRKGPHPWTRTPEDYFVCESAQGLAAARIVLHEEISRLPHSGDPVALAVNADLLLMTGAGNANGLAAMAQRARGAFVHPRAVSGITFRFADGAWRPWLPEFGHPAYAALKLLQIESQARDYLQQKRFFDELGRKAEEPLCLASFSAMEDERTGEPKSYTVWPEGLEILLPQADEVVFFQPNESGESGRVAARAPWDAVLRVVGDLMEPLEIYPPRWLVRDFPDESRLQSLSSAD